MKLSRSRTSTGLKLLVSMVLATSAILVPAGPASAADTQTPTLASFSVSDTTVTPGQQITFSYVATEGAGSLSELTLIYTDDSQRGRILNFAGPLDVAGSVTMTIPETWWNGPATLGWIRLTDPSGNKITYYAAGKTYVSPAGASGPTSHTIPFTPGDLTISGSTADATVPTLLSVSVTGSPALPGEKVSVRYETADISGSLQSIEMRFRNTEHNISKKLTYPGTDPVPLNGTIEQVIPDSWPNGTYVLTQVDVTDLHNNNALYNVGGTVFVTPPNAQGPSSNTVDFGPATFTVSGSTADFTPPKLTSISLTGSPMLPGGTATLSYAVESQDPLTRVTFHYWSSLRRLTSFVPAQPTLTGNVQVKFPADAPTTDYTLETVTLVDSAANQITYHRAGATSISAGTGGRIFGTHTIQLSSADVLLASLPSASELVFARPRSASAVVFWDHAPSVLSPVTAYTVTAQPGGRTVTTGGSAQHAEIVGLTNGTAYKFTVAATNKLGVGPARTTAAITPRMTANIIGAGDFTGDKRNDLLALKTSTDRMMEMKPSFLYRGNGLAGFAGTTALNHEYSNLDRIAFSPGDFDGNGTSDVMVVEDGGSLAFEPGNGRGGFTLGTNRMWVGSGWGSMRTVFGPGDFSGDHKNDVLAVGPAGDLLLYRGNGRGGWLTGSGQKIGTGWSNFLTVFSRGDFSGDGKTDIMAISKDGGLYLYRGNGIGGFAGAGQRIGNGWGGFLSVFSPGDFSGDRKTDVMAVNAAGALLLYRGNGRGGWATGVGQKIGNGWGIFR